MKKSLVQTTQMATANPAKWLTRSDKGSTIGQTKAEMTVLNGTGKDERDGGGRQKQK